jgi:hypothetical protein
MELTTISAALSGLKRATEMVSALTRGDVTLEKAELKVKLADVLGELAEARTALVEAHEALEANEKEMQRLLGAVRLKDQVVRYGDAYFSKASNGSPTGDPYCTFCFESDGRLLHLTDRDRNHTRVCPGCKHEVDKRRSYLPRADS